MSTYIAPMPKNISSGSTLAIARNTPVRAVARTPTTLTGTRNASEPTMMAIRRLEEGGVGRESVRTCRSGWSAYQSITTRGRKYEERQQSRTGRDRVREREKDR